MRVFKGKTHTGFPKIICASKEFLGRGATDCKVLPFGFRQKVDNKSCCDEVDLVGHQGFEGDTVTKVCEVYKTLI